MPNDHGIPDSLKELQSVAFDLLPATILSTTFPTVPVPPGMTLAAFGTRAYVRSGTDLVYVAQDPQPVTLTGADGTYWLAASTDTFADFAQWTRQAGTAYLTRPSSTQPADVDGLLVFCQLTVAGGAITAVAPIASRSTLAAAWRGLLALGTLAQQNADAVAITGGTGAFGSVGAGGAAPSAPLTLDVAGQGYFRSPVGIGVTPSTSYTLVATGPIYFPGLVGIDAIPTAGFNLVLGPHKALIQNGGSFGIQADPAYSLHVNGTFGLNGGAAAIINTTSTREIKTHIRPIPDPIGTLLALRGRAWDWRDDQPMLQEQIPQPAGLVLEEVAETHPHWIATATDGTRGVHLPGWEGYVVEALRLIVQRLDALEARLAVGETRHETLEGTREHSGR